MFFLVERNETRRTSAEILPSWEHYQKSLLSFSNFLQVPFRNCPFRVEVAARASSAASPRMHSEREEKPAILRNDDVSLCSEAIPGNHSFILALFLLATFSHHLPISTRMVPPSRRNIVKMTKITCLSSWLPWACAAVIQIKLKRLHTAIHIITGRKRA